jgi:hypothetical protein
MGEGGATRLRHGVEEALQSQGGYEEVMPGSLRRKKNFM